MTFYNEFIEAVQSGDLDSLERFVESSDYNHNLGNFALRVASAHNQPRVVSLLLSRGANVHANDNDALRKSAAKGHHELVTLLLDHGADIHADKDYALRFSISRADYDMARLLIQRGADVRLVEDHYFDGIIKQDKAMILSNLLPLFPHIRPQTLLKFANKRAAFECAKVLFSLGAKPNGKLKLSNEMHDLFISHNNRAALNSDVQPVKPGISLEPGL